VDFLLLGKKRAAALLPTGCWKKRKEGRMRKKGNLPIAICIRERKEGSKKWRIASIKRYAAAAAGEGKNAGGGKKKATLFLIEREEMSEGERESALLLLWVFARPLRSPRAPREK